MPISNSNGIEVPGFTVASVNSIPLQFNEAITEVPDDLKVVSQPAGVKITNLSVRKALKRNATIATHWLNLPFTDPLMSVSRIYKLIEQMAFNYQRQHQDAFFEAWPDMLMLSDSEKESLELTTSYLRRNYKKFAKRAAHKIYHYCEVKKMQSGSLANLMIMTRLNGNETTASLASAVRWTRINTNCKLYERFPSPKGLESYVFENTRFAVGSTTAGGDIVSLPLWITDIWGNRAQHAQSLTELFNRTTKVDDETPELLDLYGTSNEEYDKAEGLSACIANTVARYGYAHGENVPNGFYPTGYVPSMPPIENGSRIIANDDNGSVEVSRNYDGMRDNIHTPVTSASEDDNVTSRLWNNYLYWTSFLTSAFPEFSDPNSDFYVFTTRELGIVEQSSKLEDVMKTIRSTKSIDIVSLAEAMKYKANGAVTSATIVKYCPPLYDVGNDPSSLWYSEDVFSNNFERYDVDSDNIPNMIHSARKFPKLCPTIFMPSDSATPTPLILNGLEECGEFVESNFEDDKYDASFEDHTLTGKLATMFDYVRHANVTPEVNSIEASGITQAAFKQFMETHDSSAVVFDEYPSDIFLAVQPLIDNTDLAQCGFNILVCADDANPSEWENYFITNNYSSNGGCEGDIMDVPKIASAPVCPAMFAGSGKYKPAIPSCSDYLRKQKHLLVFVGGSIFMPPVLAMASKFCGYFTTDVGGWGTLSESTAMAKYNMGWKQILTRTFNPEDSSIADDAYTQQKLASLTVEDEEHNNYVALENIINSMTVAEGFFAWLYSFAPEYGPIAPLADHTMMADLSPMAPRIWAGGDMPTNDDNTEAATPACYIRRFGRDGYGTGSEPNQIEYPMLYDIKLTPAKSLLDFITKVTYAKVYTDPTTGIIDTDSESGGVTIYLGPLSKWYLLCMARQVAQYNGLRSTKPYWTAAATEGKPRPVDLGISTQIPENNIMVEPREQRSFRPAGKGMSNLVGKKPNLTTVANSIASPTGSPESNNESDNKHFKKSRKNRSGKFRNKGKDRDLSESQDGVVGPDLPPPSISKEGSTMDLSTSVEDKDFAKDKKKIIDPISIQ